MQLTRWFVLFLALILWNNTFANSAPPLATRLQYGPVPVLILKGSYSDMGFEYGQALSPELHQALNTLVSYYETFGLTYPALAQQGEVFYQRFPSNYQRFLQAEAKGANLSLDDVKILNAMETLGELLHRTPNQCAFLFVPPNNTQSGKALIGRNYDYSPPFDQLSKLLTVTILVHHHTVPTAMISIAGEVYCPSCVNAKGLFMELNNGMASGGSSVNTHTTSLLINMLTTLQHNTSLAQVQKNFSTTAADFSLIVNVANATQAESFEFSSNNHLGLKFFDPTSNQPFVSTNFFLDPFWGNEIPAPSDYPSMAVTRRNNLMNLAEAGHDFDVQSFEQLMDTPLSNGGAFWSPTIYQLIFDESTHTLYIKIPLQSDGWTPIPLGYLFQQ